MTRIRLFAGLSAICNLTVAIAVAAALLSRFPAVEAGESRFRSGARIFRYFTNDSNLFAALVCLLLLPFSLRSAVTGAGLPAWVCSAKYVAVCAVTLTLLTVICFLAPTQGFGKMFRGTNLWLHLICPVLCILSFQLLEVRAPLNPGLTFAATVPVLLYGGVYLALVVFVGEERGGWKDFYGFNRGGRWRISLVAMLGVAYLLALGQWALTRLPRGWWS